MFKTTLMNRIQNNCHIVDAKAADHYTLCVYLLKMKEYYRWDQGLALTDKLNKEAVNHWIIERETLWESVEDQDLSDLTIENNPFDPWDVANINQALAKYNLVYSAGLGTYASPHFVLADCLECQQKSDYTLYLLGKEYARELVAPPAMSLDQSIFIRTESVRRTVWERLEEWQFHSGHPIVDSIMAGYQTVDIEQVLDDLTQQMIQIMIAHEQGEIKVGHVIGKDWQSLVFELPRSQASFMVRAIRDNWADCLSTLPYLIRQQQWQGLDLYFAYWSGMRKVLFPDLLEAYWHWQKNQDICLLEQTITKGQQHWQQVATNVLALEAETLEQKIGLIEGYVNQQILKAIDFCHQN